MLQKRVRLGEFHRIQSITKGLKGIEVIYLQSEFMNPLAGGLHDG